MDNGHVQRLASFWRLLPFVCTCPSYSRECPLTLGGLDFVLCREFVLISGCFIIATLYFFVLPGYARQTRNLLFTETDQFGNVVDPSTGKIITIAGGHTPFPLPPWLDQTPAILQWMNSTTLSDTARHMFSRAPSPEVDP